MKKPMIIAIIAIVILVVIVGAVFINLNKEKTPIAASSFKSTMEQKGYTVVDTNSQFAGYDYINQAYLAESSDGSYQIEFYETSDESYAINFYNNNQARFESSKGSASSESNVNLKNSSKYTLSSNGKFMVVSRIDNTIIYVNTDEKNKDNIKDILKELGY